MIYVYSRILLVWYLESRHKVTLEYTNIYCEVGGLNKPKK